MLTTRSNYHRALARLRITAALVVALMLSGGHAAAAPATARATDLVIEGAGDGHGVGMGQDGALGYALHGLGYREILAHYYTGTALGRAPASALVRVLVAGKVHRVSLETYVRGVVSAEVPASWPLAALEAQAVASRTYALTSHAGGSRFDVYSDTRSQVYRGVAAQTPQTDAAVAATAGQIVTYEGQPAITYFSASSGGRTENVENAFPGAQSEPWLRGVADPYDQGPLHRWRLSMSFASAAARLRGLVKGAFHGIEVLSRGGSPRVLSAYVLGSAGRTLVAGSELAFRLGLYSTWAYFRVRSAAGVRAEPDRSGQSPATGLPMSAPAPVSAPASPQAGPGAGPQGGVVAPGSSEAGSTGGAAAG